MLPPILVRDEARDLMTFSSAEAAGTYMEDYDIALYTAWDAEGRVLELSPGRHHAITLSDSDRFDEAGLRGAILEAFRRWSTPIDETAPLSTLIAATDDLCRQDRAGRDTSLGSLVRTLTARVRRRR